MSRPTITQADIRNAATDWCDQKDRETFPEDIEYFKCNWMSLLGLKGYVDKVARRREAATLEGIRIGLAWAERYLQDCREESLADAMREPDPATVLREHRETNNAN